MKNFRHQNRNIITSTIRPRRLHSAKYETEVIICELLEIEPMALSSMNPLK